MKKLLAVMALTTVMAGSAHAETIKASVNGLVCSFCATGIEKTFKGEAAVDTVKVDLDAKLVTINTKDGQTMDDTKVTSLITDAGYTVTNIERVKY